jgi:CubicO group peptidase (beta-lactamase class C family)
MRHGLMRSRLGFGVIVIACLCSLGEFTQAQSGTATGSRGVHEVVKSFIDEGKIPGAIVLVRKKGEKEFLEAQGADGGYNLAPDTIVWMASMTKPIVATAVMMMVEAGSVRLEDNVSKFIPTFSKPAQVRIFKPGTIPTSMAPPSATTPKLEFTLTPAARPIQVRDLLTMTSGLQTIGVPNDALPMVTDEDTLATFTPKLADVPLDFQPGSRWAYSNATGFEVLARIVEVASDKTFRQFVQERIFKPLDMKDSSFGVAAALEKRTAPLGMIANSPIRFGKFASGSAGLWSTAHDYAQFAQMLRDGGIFQGHRLLKASSVDAMTTNEIGDLWVPGAGPTGYLGLPETVTHGLKYGFGIAVVVDTALTGHAVPVGSFGWDGVGTRRFWVIPSRDLVLVMLLPSAKGPAVADEVQRAIENAVLQVVDSKH